jgi:hypothetical protein
MMSSVHLRRALLSAALVSSVAVGGVAAGVACGGEPYSAAPDPEGQDAGAEAEAEAPDAAVHDPCDHAFVPGPPALDDAPGEELPAFFIAVRTVILTNDAAKIVGFDLDGVCSCDPHPETAHDAGPSCSAAMPQCDLARGVDNSVSVLSAQLSPFFSIDALPQTLIAKGRRTHLLQIGKYHGRLNDKEVAFGVALSDGIRDKGCPTSVENAAKGIWSPGWCGDDRWSFLPESLIPSTKQPLVQGVGYVRDGILTLKLASVLQVPFDEASVLSIGGAAMTGSLVPLGEDLKPRDRARPPTEREKRLYALDDAVIGGRIRTTDLLSTIGAIENSSKDGGASTYLCNEAAFPLLKSSVCDGVDIAATQALDFDPGAKCDALSVGIAFTAFPVLPGDIHLTNFVANPCSPGPDGQPPDSGAAAPYSCSSK